MKAKLILPVLILLAALGGAGYYFFIRGGSDLSLQNLPTTQEQAVQDDSGVVEEATKSADDNESEPEELEITVEGFEFDYNMPVDSIKAGQKVTLTLDNIGKMRHDWVVEGTEVRTEIIAGGTTDTIEFIIDEPGEYTYFCSVPGHRERGMEGVLVVE